jgi:hypothetical protein
MGFFNFDDDQMKLLLGLLLMIGIVWLISMNCGKEGFEEEKKDAPAQEKPKALELDASKPPQGMVPAYVDPNTGSIMDGTQFLDYPYNNDVRNLIEPKGLVPQMDVIGPFAPIVDSKLGVPTDLDDGAGGSLGLHYNLCSPSCCAKQWPTTVGKLKDDVVGENHNFVNSPYTCNNAWQNAGCLCMNKPQADFLYHRGGNQP